MSDDFIVRKAAYQVCINSTENGYHLVSGDREFVYHKFADAVECARKLFCEAGPDEYEYEKKRPQFDPTNY